MKNVISILSVYDSMGKPSVPTFGFLLRTFGTEEKVQAILNSMVTNGLLKRVASTKSPLECKNFVVTEKGEDLRMIVTTMTAIEEYYITGKSQTTAGVLV